MNFSEVRVKNDGYVYCRSRFYTAHDLLQAETEHIFSKGINKLVGEIDSGVWAISYLLSMYPLRKRDFTLFEDPIVYVDNHSVSLAQLSKHSCYLDPIYPLFSQKVTVRKQVERGIKRSSLKISSDEIKQLFHMSDDRFERPLYSAGNEMIRAMAAIGYSYGKSLFCFPWMSDARMKGYHNIFPDVLQVLETAGKYVIVPLGKE